MPKPPASTPRTRTEGTTEAGAHRQMVTAGKAKGDGPTNGGLDGIEILGPLPSQRHSSDLVLFAHVLIVRSRLLVHKNPEES